MDVGVIPTIQDTRNAIRCHVCEDVPFARSAVSGEDSQIRLDPAALQTQLMDMEVDVDVDDTGNTLGAHIAEWGSEGSRCGWTVDDFL